MRVQHIYFPCPVRVTNGQKDTAKTLTRAVMPTSLQSIAVAVAAAVSARYTVLRPHFPCLGIETSIVKERYVIRALSITEGHIMKHLKGNLENYNISSAHGTREQTNIKCFYL